MRENVLKANPRLLLLPLYMGKKIRDKNKVMHELCCP